MIYYAMKFPHLLFLDTPIIIVIVAASVVGLALIGVLLYFTLFSRVRYKKQVRELSRRFEYLHALLSGQDSQYIKRIEIISLTNLLYVKTHMQFNKRFKDIRDKSDSSAQTAINNLKDLAAEHDYKGLKAALPAAKIILENYEEEVNALTNDLVVVIRPEEECRQEAIALKEQLRKIKQDYYVKQADLSLVSSTFDAVFKKIDDQFNQFESYVESAVYDEAKALLPNLAEVIKQLAKSIQELPDICITITTIIPEKISSLANRFEEMRAAGYPLFHLMNEEQITQMKEELDAVSARVQNFDLRYAAQELDAIQARISDYMSAFDKEKEARTIFETECEGIYANDTAIEKKYIHLCNALPNVKRIFVIPPEEQTKIDGIKNLINIAGATKRSLDTFIHSGTKQPYSLLVEKMHALRDEAAQASEAIDEFDRYLFSLKADSEAAMEAVQLYYEKLHVAEVRLRDLGVAKTTEAYQSSINDLYQVISELYEKIRTTPIDVAAVDELVLRLKTEGDSVCSNVKKDYEQALLSDSAVLYANRFRQNIGEVNDAIRQVEHFYFDGEFKRAYDETIACIKRIRGE